MPRSALDLAPTPLLVAQTVRLGSSRYRSKRTRVSTSPLESQRSGCATRLEGQPSRQSAATITRSPTAPTEKDRPVSRTAFLSYGSLTFKRTISGRRIRGPISRLILIGSRCLSGQSRSVARSVAVVSHLRKMTLLSHRPTRGATSACLMSPLIPLFTGAWAVQHGVSMLYAPGRSSGRITRSSSTNDATT